MRRRLPLTLTCLFVLATAAPMLAADKVDEAKERQEAERKRIKAAEQKRKDAVKSKIRLLEALEGASTPAPKVEPKKKVGGSARIRPTQRTKREVEWTKTFEAPGEIEDSNKVKTYGQGRTRTYTIEPEPTVVEFKVESDVWRMSWITEPTARSGKLKMVLKRKITTPSGLTQWRPYKALPSVRAGAKGGVVLQAEGEYMLELLGQNVKYHFNVEEAKVVKVEPKADDKPEAKEKAGVEKKDAKDPKPAAEAAKPKAEAKKP